MSFHPQPFIPQHPILKKYVRFYYFLNAPDPAFDCQYFAFPQTDTVLNIHRQASFEIKEKYTRVYHDPDVRFNACLQGLRDFPLLAHLQGQLDKITVLFKPLGKNQFGISDFGERYSYPSMPFTSWDKLSAYQNFLTRFYSTNDITSRVLLFESFLMEIYQPLADDLFLSEAINLMTNFEDDYSIAEICSKLNINIRTLNRSFRRHIGVAAASFRKIARFRNSLENKHLSAQFTRLTDIAYKSNYYDQAYFTKVYQKLTGANPQRFFANVERFADNRLIFEFTK